MCGDLDEDVDSGAEQRVGAFVHAVHDTIHDVVDHRGGSRTLPPGALTDAALHRYMDGLFAEVLRACVTDGGKTDAESRYRLLAAQSIVLARTAGFLAHYLDLGQDPLRALLEAAMEGYSGGAASGHHHH